MPLAATAVFTALGTLFVTAMTARPELHILAPLPNTDDPPVARLSDAKVHVHWDFNPHRLFGSLRRAPSDARAALRVLDASGAEQFRRDDAESGVEVPLPTGRSQIIVEKPRFENG